MNARAGEASGTWRTSIGNVSDLARRFSPRYGAGLRNAPIFRSVALRPPTLWSRSQAPAWERPCLGGSSLPFPSGALCFWRSGRRLEPPRILHSQAGAWERARVTRDSKLNLMAVGQRPRSLGERPLALKARSIPPEIWNALTALNALFFEVLGRCPRLVWSRAVGPERRRATTGSCPKINAALWPPASLRVTTLGAPFSLLRPICKLVGNGKESPPLSNAIGLRNYPKCFLRPSDRRCGGERASLQSYNTLARSRRGMVFPHRTVSASIPGRDQEV